MWRLLIVLLMFAVTSTTAANDRPFLGVRFGDGAKIEHLFDGAPAQEFGLKVGDVIVRADDKPIEATAEISEYLAEQQPGDGIELRVVRDGEELTIKVQLAKHTVKYYLKQLDPPRIPGGNVELGGGTIDSDYQTGGNTWIKSPSTITGSLTQTWTGVLDLRLTKPDQPPVLNVGGPISLAGLLYVKIEGHVPTLGDRFELIGNTIYRKVR